VNSFHPQCGGVHETQATPEWTPTKWEYEGGVFTTFRPLDDELGTGVLDAERAIRQFDAGEQAPGFVGVLGWNRDALSPALDRDVYKIERRIRRGDFITVTLAWDRVMTEGDGDGIVEPGDAYTDGDVPDFDIEIYKVPYPYVLIAQSFGIGGASGLA
jgi:hypothetical protein